MPVDKYDMSKEKLSDIQRSLNIIRGELERADAQTRLRALELMMATSQSVIAASRKLQASQQKFPSKPKPIRKPIKPNRVQSPNATVGYLSAPEPKAHKPK